MKKLLFLLLLIPTVAHAGFFDFFHRQAEPTIITGDINIRPLDQFTSTTTPSDAITQRIWGKSLKITGLTAGQCLKLDSNSFVISTACGAGGGGGGGGTWATTTSTVSGQLTNYPNNDTDIVTIGSSATTSSEFYFDPNTLFAKIGGQLLITGSTTLQNFTSKNSTSSQATTTNLAISSILSKILKTNGSGSVVEATAGVDYQAVGAYLTAVTVDSPLSGAGTSASHLVIADGAADGSTKGAVSFTAADFNSSSGNISLDYTNGQAASASLKGFLTSGDWGIFNNKISSTSLSGIAPIEYNSSTGVISCPTCGVSTGNWATTSEQYFWSQFRDLSVQGSGYLAPTTTRGFIFTASSTASNLTSVNSTTTNATTTNQNYTGISNKLLATDATGNVVGTTTISTNLLNLKSFTVTTAAPLGGAATVNLGDTLALTCTGCLTANQTITLSGDVTGSGATSIITAINPTTRDWSLGGATWLRPTTTVGIIVSASSTISALTVTNGTTTNATSTNIFSSKLTLGTESGCASFASGVLTGTGVACGSGSGGGNSKWGTTTNNLDITPNGLGGIIVNASSTIDQLSVRNGTTTNATSTTINVANLTATGSTTLQNFTAKNATTTNATTTGFGFTGITSSLLATNPSGGVIATSTIGNAQLQNSSLTFTTAAPLGGAGTYSLGQTVPLTCTGCLTANQTITLTGDVLGSGTTNITTTLGPGIVNRDWKLLSPSILQPTTTPMGILVNNSTSTITNLSSFYGTTTNATSTNLYVSGQTRIGALSTALALAGSTGILSSYAGSANPCTNQVPTTISAVGGLGGCISINGSWWSGTDLAVVDGGTGLSTLGGTNRVIYTSTTDNLASEAAFTYDQATNILTADSFLANASSTFQNFTGKLATTTSATTTNFFATTASTTNFFGAGLPGVGCISTSFLQWSAGLFSCGTPASGGGANSKFATSTGDTAAIYTVGLAGISSVGIGTTTPHWSLQVASTTPFIGISDTNASLDKKHGLISYQDGIFVIGTSSDALTSTSSAVSIDPNQASSINIGSTTQSVSSVNGLFVQGTNGASGTSTQSTGKWQVDMYNSAGTRSCMFVVGTTLTVIAGACNP